MVPAYMAVAMYCGWRRQFLRHEPLQVVRGNSRLVSQHQHRPAARRGQVGDAGANGTREPLAPFMVDHDRAGRVLEQWRKFRGLRAEHDDEGVAG